MKKRLTSLLLATLAFSLSATAQSAPSLAWNPNPVGDLVTGYNVYEHVGTVYNLLTPTPITVTTYSLAGAPAGQHVYAVTALNLRGESAKSTDATLPAAPTAPAGLKVLP
jgi:hypothetical protein